VSSLRNGGKGGVDHGENVNRARRREYRAAGNQKPVRIKSFEHVVAVEITVIIIDCDSLDMTG
jgi:hypothetical protein